MKAQTLTLKSWRDLRNGDRIPDLNATVSDVKVLPKDIFAASEAARLTFDAEPQYNTLVHSALLDAILALHSVVRKVLPLEIVMVRQDATTFVPQDPHTGGVYLSTRDLPAEAKTLCVAIDDITEIE